MPNHIHALIGFQNTGKRINTIIGNGKRFMAYQIIDRLKVQNEEGMLNQLQLAVETKNKERNKLHEVWDDSFDWKDCTDFINRSWIICIAILARESGILLQVPLRINIALLVFIWVNKAVIQLHGVKRC
jgi:hypothetical protein